MRCGAAGAACSNACVLTPCTGDVMPSGREREMYGANVTIVVHPPIPTVGSDADSVCDEARRVIASSLPKELVGDASVMSSE